MTRLLALLVLSSFALAAQPLTEAALNGAYNFVELRADVTESGIASNARNISGAILFDGVGGYSFQGQLGVGSSAATAAAGAGVYTVSSNGFVTLTNPIDSALTLDARLGAGGEVVLGSSVDDLSGRDIFVAVRQASGASTATLLGTYTASYLLFPDGSDAGVGTAIAFFEADGAGGLGSILIEGHSAALGDAPLSQSLSAAAYTVGADGAGTLVVGPGAGLFEGTLNLAVSGDGSIVLGASPDADSRDVFLAVRRPEATVSSASFSGNYWVVELLGDLFDGSYTGAVGAVRADGDSTATLAERISINGAADTLDFAVVQSFGLSDDGRGFLRGFPEPEVTNFALGEGAFTAAEVHQTLPIFDFHGISFGVRLPDFAGEGVFVSPVGVLNAASFAPATAPISPGALLSVFGSLLAGETAEAVLVPLPTELVGVSVTVNGVPAPLFFVSAGQINLQAPFGLSGDTAEIVVTNNGSASNTVRVPVAASSPGIFSLLQTGVGPGIITDASFGLISEANPAAPGQTVIIFLTGLGVTDPSFGDGAAAPGAEPFARTEAPLIEFGGEAGAVLFSGAAPGFVGLYQINVTIPDTVFAGAVVPVAISTTNAIVDLVDIAIGF